ncbi:MAG: hypothetical protein V1709_02570, partial [Planctomycetota bacterium]
MKILLVGLSLFVLLNNSQSETKERVFSRLDTDSEIQRLKEALNEKNLQTKLWAVRSLAKYPQSLSGPLLMEQFDKYISEDTL